MKTEKSLFDIAFNVLFCLMGLASASFGIFAFVIAITETIN